MAQQQINDCEARLSRRLNRSFRRLRQTLLQVFELGMEKFTRPVPKATKLLIIDDFFPDLRTGFRLAEFHFLQNHYQDVVIFSSCKKPISTNIPLLKRISAFAPLWKVYRNEFGEHARSVYKFNQFRKIKADLAYLIFIVNTDRFLNYLEYNQIPFIFTLYPGGGFMLNDLESDRKLARVFASPLFRGVIVTQPITRNYLLDKHLCAEDKIHYSFGVVVDSKRYLVENINIISKNRINICFVAFKYMNNGLDKGYDVFIDTCRLLKKYNHQFSFNVVGNFTSNDIDVSDLGEDIHYHGPLFGDQLKTFFQQMDIVVAPNRAFKLFPGAFDGFPTGCCVEAALSGVAVFCSDPLQQNQPFIVNEHFVQIDTDPIAITEAIRSHVDHPEKLVRLRHRGQKRFAEIYDIEKQMQPRIAAIEQATAEVVG